MTVATAVAARQHMGPEQLDDTHRADPAVRALADKITVVHADDLDAALPDHRGARLTVELRDGRRLQAHVTDPVGDVDHQPFDEREISDKLARLLGDGTARRVVELSDALPGAEDVGPLLGGLP